MNFKTISNLLKEKKWNWIDYVFVGLIILFNTSIYFYLGHLKTTKYLLITNLDLSIPFIPIFVYFYIFLVLYVIIGIYILKKDSIERRKVLIGLVIINIIASIFFLFFNVYNPRPSIFNIDGLTKILLNRIYSSDAPTNGFPSLHVSQTAIVMYYLKNKYLCMLIVGILIILSTLFIKQHCILDVMGGLAVTFFTIVLVEYLYLKIRN